RGEPPALSPDERDPRLGVPVDHRPHVSQLAVDCRTDRVQPGTVQHHAEHAGGGPLEAQVWEVSVGIGHESSSVEPGGRSKLAKNSYIIQTMIPDTAQAVRSWRGLPTWACLTGVTPSSPDPLADLAWRWPNGSARKARASCSATSTL